ncbi:flagellar basal body rod protein FlgG [Clostridium swellfunianum]|uniref:flagellar hook-basal body complex protein n=1 Tax=Clostridium swellfunianum TaxID=1367462 RepID=UPI00202FAC67|nr:flagellar hook-basal body complex protein [Clostridium swellfunianum]MCM0650430.1 flagellar basal body rod protein FlgG [Clostridium swellfunianum]
MIRSLYTSVSGLITQEAKQNVITNNLANVNTVGFKGDNLSVKKFDDVLIQNYDKLINGKNVQNVIGSISQGSRIDEVNTSFTGGMLETTDKWSDFAIDGKGFFSVLRDNNGLVNTFYSRDGHLHVNGQGFLVNNSGDKILASAINDNGMPISAPSPIQVGNREIKLQGNGRFSLDGQNYKFATVDFENYSSLRKIGDNLYQGENPIQGDDIYVKQGYLEKSNVNVINEMVNMMTTMRTFESNQKILQSIDETLGKAVNEVGTVR